MSFFHDNWNTIQYLIPIFYILIVCTISSIFSKNITANRNKKNDKSRPRDRHDISDTQEKKFNIDDKIRDLKLDAEKCNTPETFVQHSRIQRQIIKLQREANKLGEIIKEEGGALTEAELDRTRIDDLKKSGSNNKLLVAFGLSVLLSRLPCIFNIDKEKVFPLEKFMGSDSEVREIDGKTHYAWEFHLTLFFAFLTVRFSTRMGRLFGWE